MFHYQTTEYNCGPASVQNAFAAQRKRISQKSLALVCGTDENGTDEEGIKRGILAYQGGYDETHTNDWFEASQWLERSMQCGRPVILCVDHWTHWVCVIGLLGWSPIIFDPSRDRLNIDRQGLQVLKPADLRRRWGASRRARGKLGKYYGLAVSVAP